MTRDELIQLLNELKVNPCYYSLDGNLFPDCVVVQKKELVKVIYVDDRGGVTVLGKYRSMEEGYKKVYEHFKRAISNYGEESFK